MLAAFAACGALVDAGLDYTDALDDFDRPACGYIAVSWHDAQTNGTTAVLAPSGYSTPIWNLRLFSGGNPYPANWTSGSGHGYRVSTTTNTVTGTTTVQTNRLVGTADIPINAQTLAAWRQTFANARANGALVTPRFTYDTAGVPGCEPSDFSVIVAHIAQIAEVLNEYADIVPSVECGMFGLYGEMHNSAYNDAEHSSDIIRAWLEALDPRIKLQVRRPQFFFWLLNDCRLATNLLARQDEFDPGRRLGLFDDGYLGTIHNYGTYNGLATDGGVNGFNRRHACDFLRERSHIPYGGEFSTVSSNEAAQVLNTFATSGWNLIEEWYATHLSYLRANTRDASGVGAAVNAVAFHAADCAFDGMPSLSEWEGSTLFDFLRAHMGHRFVLRGSRLPATATPGETLALSFDIENTGFGDLFLPTETEILLQRQSRVWTIPAEIDLGNAVPSTSNATLSVSIQLPSSLTGGDWNVYVRTHVVVEDNSSSATQLRTIRFANPASQWNAAIAGNLLGTVRIEGEEDPLSGHDWRLETHSNHLRMVCADCGDEHEPAPGFDRRLPGREMSTPPVRNGVLTFASDTFPFVPDPPCDVLYPAFTVSGISPDGAMLGDLYTVTVVAGTNAFLRSNASANLKSRNDDPAGAAAQTIPLPSDGAYLTDIPCRLVNWHKPYLYGTVREFSLNDPSATRGGASVGLENAELATLGLFSADPCFHVWFCDQDWTVLCETNGPLAGSLAGSYHTIPIPAVTNLFVGEGPAEFASTDTLCRQCVGWKRLDGTDPGWALGDVAVIPDYVETSHIWEAFPGTAGEAMRLRCTVCGHERTLPELVCWFDVRFVENGYRLGINWSDLSGIAADGTWECPTDDTTTLVQISPNERALALDSPSGPVYYSPSQASSGGVDLTVEGRTSVQPLDTAATLPIASSGGLSFVADGETGEPVPYGHTADGWCRLSGATPHKDDWATWRMDFDLSSTNAPRVRYLLDDATLFDESGAEWLPLDPRIDHVESVGFQGFGFIGDFHGSYTDFGNDNAPASETDPPRPAFGATDEGPALAFAVDPATGAPVLLVRIANAQANVYYTAFTSETLTGAFTAEGDSHRATEDGAFLFTIDASPNSKFVIIVAGDVFHHDGDPLPTRP